MFLSHRKIHKIFVIYQRKKRSALEDASRKTRGAVALDGDMWFQKSAMRHTGLALGPDLAL
jgi:hypothetical protein